MIQKVLLSCWVIRCEELVEDACLVDFDRAVGRSVLGDPLDVGLGLGRAGVAIGGDDFDGLTLFVRLERLAGDREGTWRRPTVLPGAKRK